MTAARDFWRFLECMCWTKKAEQRFTHYPSPVGKLLLAAEEAGLTGIWMEGAKYYAATLAENAKPGNSPALEETKRWLDLYFSGKDPGFLPPIHLPGTAFQKRVWACLLEIPYGTVTTYGAIANQLGVQRMAARAVGSAVGHNPISIVVPCHRVVGADGTLTGYAGGLDIKRRLLALEGVDIGTFR